MKLTLSSRNELPTLLDKLALHGEGVEVGVRTGNYSYTILKKSKLSRLYSVDPWLKFDKKKYHDILNFSQRLYDFFYVITVVKLLMFGSRSVCMRMTSKDAAALFEDNSLDFVYIDANHAYDACKLDIALWWPKVKKQGVFAGHDYLDGRLYRGDFGVKRAVDEFVKAHTQKLYVTKDPWPSWYLVKC